MIKCYKSDFDGNKMQIHGNKFFDKAKLRKVPIKNVHDYLKLMKNDGVFRQKLPESNNMLVLYIIYSYTSIIIYI